MTGRILAVMILLTALVGTSLTQDPKPAGAPAERDLKRWFDGRTK